MPSCTRFVRTYRPIGASTMMVTGLARDRHKLDLAREFGADHTINVEEEDATVALEERYRRSTHSPAQLPVREPCLSGSALTAEPGPPPLSCRTPRRRPIPWSRLQP